MAKTSANAEQIEVNPQGFAELAYRKPLNALYQECFNETVAVK